MDRMDTLRNQFVRQFQVPMEWRFEAADITNAEQPDFDDSAWRRISPRFSWTGTNTAWFRATITVPATVGGQSTANFPLVLELGMTNQGELYVDGRLIAESRRLTGPETLTEEARPGTTFVVAIKARGQPHNGFHYARLYCNVVPDFDRYLDDATFVTSLMPEVSRTSRQSCRRPWTRASAASNFLT